MNSVNRRYLSLPAQNTRFYIDIYVYQYCFLLMFSPYRRAFNFGRKMWLVISPCFSSLHRLVKKIRFFLPGLKFFFFFKFVQSSGEGHSRWGLLFLLWWSRYVLKHRKRERKTQQLVDINFNAVCQVFSSPAHPLPPPPSLRKIFFVLN